MSAGTLEADGTAPAKRWIPEIEAIKALAIVGVLIAHLSFVGRFAPSTLALIGGLKSLLGWCVLAFFFTSGMVASRLRSFAENKTFTLNRFRRLIVPCIVFTVTYKVVLDLAYCMKLGSVKPTIPLDGWGLLAFLFDPVGPQFYFLPYLFFVSVCVSQLRFFLGNRSLLVLAGACLLLCSHFFKIPSAGYGPDFGLLPLYTFAYVSGCVLSPRNGEEDPFALALISGLLALTLAATRNQAVVYAAAPVLLYFFLRAAGGVSNAITATKIGEYSSGIYVWHDPIVMPLFSILFAKLLPGPLVILPVLLCTLLLCMAIQNAVERFPALRYYRF